MRNFSRWRALSGLVAGALAVAVLAGAGRASAQVNVEPLRAKLADDAALYQVGGSLTLRQGNTNSAAASASSFAGWRAAPYLGYVTATADYAAVDGTANLTKLFTHGRFERHLWRVLHGETFAQWEHDPFRELETRELLGAGPRIELRSEQWEFDYGSSYMLAVTRRSPTAGATAHVVRHRWNNYATLNYAPHPNVALSETVYFQPRFDRFRDYFLLSVFAANFTVTPLLTSGIGLMFRRESVVPQGVRRDDIQLVNSLNLTF